jgi:hypothetical protein
LVELPVDRHDLEECPSLFFCTGHFRERPSLSVEPPKGGTPCVFSVSAFRE